MNWHSILSLTHVFISVFLIFLVCIQSQEGGLSPALSMTGSYHSKRGLEKVVFISTLIFGFLFCASSFGQLFLAR